MFQVDRDGLLCGDRMGVMAKVKMPVAADGGTDAEVGVQNSPRFCVYRIAAIDGGFRIRNQRLHDAQIFDRVLLAGLKRGGAGGQQQERGDQ